MGDNSNSSISRNIQIIGAIVILSMAVGNMFVSHRMKQIMKDKGFYWNIWKNNKGNNSNGTNNTNSTNKSNNGNGSNSTHNNNGSDNVKYKSTNTSRNSNLKYSRTKKSIYKLPDKIIQSLTLLNLQPNILPTRTELKTAYRKIALSIHPDTLPLDDPRKNDYSVKFRELTEAYNTSMKYIDDREMIRLLKVVENMSEYQFLLFYVYQPIPNCSYLTDFFERICTELQIRGRIRVSMEGSNGIISGTLLAIQKFKMDVIRQLENFPFHWYQSGLVETLPREIQLFDSLSVKITKEVVSLDLKEDIMKDVIEASSGKFLSPQQFHSYLSQMENQSGNPSDIKLIDIRNQYEVRIGKFMGKTFEAINPETHIVNYFDNHIDELKGKTVLMYCTGGVRCERASAYLKYKGITDVYQLEGGIHAYQTAFGEDGYFRGKNFVFDPRIAISNTEASRFNKVMIDPIHSDSNSNSNNSIEQGDNMNLYEEKKLNRNYSQPHDKSMDSACRDTKVQSIGHCLVCGDIWDDYSAHQRCSDCRLLLLLCNTCISTDEISSHKHLLKCELCFKRKNSSK